MIMIPQQAPPPAGMIARKRLSARVAAQPECMWLVVGPAFSGKSVLLDEIAGDIGKVIVRLGPDNDWAPDEEVEAGIFIVVDEFDSLEERDAGRAAALLRTLVMRGSAIVASRSYPEFPLAKWRLNGRLRDISAAELALTPDEVQHLLEDFPDCGPDEVGFITRRISGWLAPLCILRSLKESDDRSLREIAAEFSGGAGMMRAFIEQEIISSLDPQERLLIETIAAFEEIRAENVQTFVADNPRQRLAALSRKLPLLEPKNAIEDAYSLHPILKEFCEAELRGRDPDRWEELVRAAASNCAREENGLGAASLLLKIGDHEEAARILGQHADRAFGDLGATQEFFSLCRRLPKELAGSLNETFWIARGAVVAGAFGYAARLIGHLEAQDDGKRDDDRLRVIRILVDLGFADFDSVYERSHACLAGAESSRCDDAIGPLDRAMIASALALACLARLDMRGCERAIVRAKAESDRADALYFKGWVSIINILRLREMARFDEAIVEARDLVARGSHAALRPTCQLILANLLWSKGKLAEAKDLVERYYRIGAKHGVAETAMLALEAGAHVEQYVAGTNSALELVRDSEHPIDRAFGERARRLAKIKYLEIMLLGEEVPSGEDIPALLEEMRDWNRKSRSGDLWLEERATFVRALYALRSGDPRSAIKLIGPVATRAKAAGRVLAASEASLVRIAAESHLNDADRVSRALLSTIEDLAQLGAEGVVVRFQPILKLPLQRLEPMARGQSRLTRDQTAEIIRGLTDIADNRADSDADGDLLLEVSLTPTEGKVLKHVSTGLRNAEIADRMLMSAQTVKWHLHNIFAKMGVRNRTRAILRAKELMLL